MPAKRKSKTELPESKRNRDEPVTFVVSGQNKATVVVGLLKEQEREITVLIASDVAAARQMVADGKKQQTIEVIGYKTPTPPPPPPGQSAVVLPHELAQPSRIAAAMASEGRITRLLTVLDARSFLDDWERLDDFPPGQEAAKADVRAHLHDRKARVVLAEQIESADTIVLTHTEQADADEVEMMAAILQELNSSATVVAREGDGVRGGKVKFASGLSGFDAPAPAERGGCLQVRLAARQDDGAGEEDEEEEEDDDEEEVDDEEEEDEGEEESDGEDGGDDDGEEGDGEDDEWVPPVMTRFAFLSRRPFHPARLDALLEGGLPGGVIRSAGPIWVANNAKEALTWNQVSNTMELLPGEPWLAAKLPVAQWPDDAPAWARTAPHGDRRVELGLIGMDADVAMVRRHLKRALVTKAEFEAGVWGRHEGEYWWLLGTRANKALGRA